MSDPSQNDTDSSKQNKEPRWAGLKPYQFKPGQSGNPGGRRKSPVSELYDEILQDPEFRKKWKETVKFRLLQKKSVIGGVMQEEKMAERIEGKVAEKMELNINLNLSDRLRKAKERMSSKS